MAILKIQGPQNPVLSASDDANYAWMAVNENYKAYFKANSNTSRSVRFLKNGYLFDLDISTSQLHWYSSTLNAIVGMQAEMNPQNTSLVTDGKQINYATAWINTDLQYSPGVSTLKETLVIHAVSPPSSGVNVDFLQYVANCYYDDTLTIVADGVSYLHPTNQNFTTVNEIVFKDSQGNMVYGLPTPTIYDSAGNLVSGIYAVTANDGILIINIRIPKSFMDAAVYPVYFDPPVMVQGNAQGYTAAGTSTTITCSMASTPTQGNLLIACIGIYSSALSTVSGITQTGVTWAYAYGYHVTQSHPNDVEIWVGVVGAGASKNISVATSAAITYSGILDVCEWSGLSTTIDVSGTYKSSGSTSTPAVSSTGNVGYSNEVGIACVQSNAGGTLTIASGSYTGLDGVNMSAYGALLYGYLINPATGSTTTCSCSDTSSYYCIACIATFIAAAGETDIPIADSGSGSDSVSSSAALSVADSGSGADAVSTIGLSVSDSGSGSDAVSNIGLSISDSGVGTDSASSSATLSISDVGSGVDTVTNIGLSVSDSGSGVDAISSSATINASDIGSGVDSATSSASLAVSDSGVGADAVQKIGLPISDSGSGVDAAASYATLTISDSGSGVETAKSSASLSTSDSGSGVDTVTSNATFPLNDVGTGAESSALSSLFNVADSGSGVDAISKIGLPLNDVGTGVESSALSSLFNVADSGSGVDAISKIGLPLNDVGTGVESSALSSLFNVADSGSGVDAISKIGLPLNDVGTGADSAVSSATINVADSGSGLESVILILPVSDSASGTDTAITNASLQVGDSGVGVDSTATNVVLSLNDFGVGVDSVSSQANIQVVDLGFGVEVVAAGAIVPRYVLIIQSLTFQPEINETDLQPKITQLELNPKITETTLQ